MVPQTEAIELFFAQKQQATWQLCEVTTTEAAHENQVFQPSASRILLQQADVQAVPLKSFQIVLKEDMVTYRRTVSS